MRKWFAGGLVLALVMAVFAASSVLAASATPAPAPSGGSPGQGLEISPPVMELAADPGQTVTASIRVRNVTKGELIAKGKADDFGAGSDESGQPKLLLDETGATRFSLKYWVGGVPDLTLAPGELKTTTVTIAVPGNAEPGGHFGVIRFTAVPPDLQGTGVALSASVGTLVLLKVNGAVTDNLNLAEFSAAKITKSGSDTVMVKKPFFEQGPVGFVMRIKNDGSVHEKPQGTVTVKDTFGKQVASLKVNENGGNVLPDSIRKFEQTWDKKGLFGVYTANLALTYAANKKLSGTVKFWVVPWKLILVVFVALVVLFFVLRWAIRKYNDHIISKSSRR